MKIRVTNAHGFKIIQKVQKGKVNPLYISDNAVETGKAMGSLRVGHDWNDLAAAAAAAAAATVHRYQNGWEQSGRITQVTVKQ